MATAVLGYKRKCDQSEDDFLLDGHISKRCRLEALIAVAGDDNIASPAVAEALAVAVDPQGNAALSEAMASMCRRRHHEDTGVETDGDNQSDEDTLLPAEKRLCTRMMEAICGGSSDSGFFESSAGSREPSEFDIRGWSQKVVYALHGCPSVEQALQRGTSVLSDFSTEIRKTVITESEAVREEEIRRAVTNDELTRQMNSVFRRAIRHLAERCRLLEANGNEKEQLRQELENSQAAQRRLKHSNDLLQAHLRNALDSSQETPLYSC